MRTSIATVCLSGTHDQTLDRHTPPQGAVA